MLVRHLPRPFEHSRHTTDIFYLPPPLHRCPQPTNRRVFRLQGCFWTFAQLSSRYMGDATIDWREKTLPPSCSLIPSTCAVLEHSTVTRITHRISHPRTFDNYHRSSSYEFYHRSRVWTRRPGCAACWCVLLSFSSLSSRPKVLMDHEEEVGGSGSAPPVCEAQLVVSQDETLDETSSSACCCIQSGVFRPFMSIRGGSNNDHSQNDTTGDQPTQAGQLPSQAEAQIRAYFHDCRDIIGLTQNQSRPIM